MSDDVPDASVVVIEGDNLAAMAAMPDASYALVYLDPPFNTGRVQGRAVHTSRPHSPADSDAVPAGRSAPPRSSGVSTDATTSGWSACSVPTTIASPTTGTSWRRASPRPGACSAADGTLYLHLDYRESHYAKVALDALFGRDCFLNEIIWAYDYGRQVAEPMADETRHDPRLRQGPANYVFDSEAVDREPYMAPGLVTPEKAARGKLPTDVWWHTIVPTTGREKTGYPTQKPEGILRRIVSASTRAGDAVLDPFAGSGTTGAVAGELGRRAVLIDHNPDAIEVMARRMPGAEIRRQPSAITEA